MDPQIDLRTHLQRELILRIRKNPAYSLRSFARTLGISPSFLSKLINGQRRITPRVFHNLVDQLDLSPSEISQLKGQQMPPKGPELNLKPIGFDQFKVISDWYHYAILELTHIKGFKSEPSWIATKLGISQNQVKSAIERLLQLELLELKRGRLVASSGGNTTVSNEFTQLAFKKMQDELLHKGISCLWELPIELRDNTSICMAIDPNDIPEVKKRLTRMRREICEFLERKPRKKPTQVYNLSLAFFPLTHPLTKETP